MPKEERELWSTVDVCRRFAWSRSKLYALIRSGKFPRGRDVGGKATWTAADLEAYLLLAGRWQPGGAEETEKES